MRGKVDDAETGDLVHRITPAYAGKRLCYSLCLPPLWDHPRVCGEKVIPCTPGLHIKGSPPRMRGKAGSHTQPNNEPGITPAYAGKSLTIQKMSTASRDHPRVCGEKCCLNVIPNSIKGSPPRMRGKVTLLYALADREGITPAYAGKSAVYAEIVLYCGDHPRVCGEKPFPARQARMCRGSPPRMRGKDRRAVDGKSPPGITPAYAGKRCWCGFSGRLGGDHPRVCGEKGRAVPPWAEEPGSPPRMRGKVLIHSIIVQPFGITPAYAGKRN